MKVVYGRDLEIATWVGERIAADFNTRFDAKGNRQFHAIGVEHGNKIIAGVVYHNYYHEVRAIEISMASDTPTWAKPEIIGELLYYPFITLNCQRISTLTPAKNQKALKFNYHLGFTKEGLIRRGDLTDDIVLNGMLIEEADRWLTAYRKKASIDTLPSAATDKVCESQHSEGCLHG